MDMAATGEQSAMSQLRLRREKQRQRYIATMKPLQFRADAADISVHTVHVFAEWDGRHRQRGAAGKPRRRYGGQARRIAANVAKLPELVPRCQ